MTYAEMEEGVKDHREDARDRNYRPWAISSAQDRLRPAASPAQTRPCFDQPIENKPNLPAVSTWHRAYMRDEESSNARQPDARDVDDDHYTATLRRVAHEARRNQERSLRRMGVAQGVCKQAPSAQRGSNQVFVQGVLASEIGLVASAASRRGPIIRSNPQDLELAGYHTAFGYVSSKMYATAEREDAARDKRAHEYRLSLHEQVTSDKTRQQRSKVDGEAERKHAEEEKRSVKVKLESIRASKLKMLAVEGVKTKHMNLLANYPM